MRSNELFSKSIVLLLFISFFLVGGDVALAGILDQSELFAENATRDTANVSQHDLLIQSDSNKPFLRRYGAWILAGAGGASLFAFDKSIKKYSQRNSLHSTAADNFFKPVHDLGQGWEFAIAIPLYAGHGLIWKKNRSMAIAGELLTGLALDGAVTEGFKISFGRLRPNASESPFKFFKGGRSIFSGDVSVMMTFATIMSKEYPSQNLGFLGIHHNVPLLPILLYSATGLVACQRLYTNEHWSSDVFYGALAGHAAGIIAVHFGKKIHLKGFSIAPGKSSIVIANFSL